MKKLLIIETIPDCHGASEGIALQQSLEIMKKSWDGRTTRQLKIDVEQAFTKKSFLTKIEEETDFLHISAHGKVKKTKKGNQHVLLIGKAGKEVTPNDIKSATPKRHVFL
jgi:hypothetical protein